MRGFRVGLVAALAALAVVGAAAAREPSRSPLAGSAVPIPPGQVDQAVAGLDGIVTEALQRSGVPGAAVAVVHNGAVVYSKGFGVRRVGSPQPVDQNTIFQLASVSKPIGATAIARAVGQGKLSWDDPIVKHLPGFRLKSRTTSRQVTIADVYSHRSGLPGHIGDKLETQFGYGRGEILRRLRYVPLAPLRAEYAYTNFGLTAGGAAAARAAGLSWAEFVRRTLYRPLGMRSSSSRFADFARAPNHATTHQQVGGRWQVGLVRTPDPQSPAGGVSSNVVDLARWMRLLLDEGSFGGSQFLAPGAFAEMWTPHTFLGPPKTPDARTTLSGLGIDIATDSTGRVRYTHSGAFVSGASTEVTMIPAENLGIAVLTNGQPVGVPESITQTFMDLAELGAVQRDWYGVYNPAISAQLYTNPSVLAGRQPPARPRRAHRRSAYIGRYTNGYAGPIRVTTRRGRLTLLLGPRGRAFPLTSWGGNTFSYLPTGEDSTGISAVKFGFKRGGRRAATVTLEDLDPVGTLRRR